MNKRYHVNPMIGGMKKKISLQIGVDNAQGVMR